ncbi:GIY-YIG nuclease family protein [Snuella lapsa]
MLKCNDNTHYVGFTSSLEQRLKQHKMGVYPNSYT